MAQSTGTRAITFILRELIGELLYFPVWWYSYGLAATAKTLLNNWLGTVNRLSILIMLRTMGKPMYGDYTRSGKIISFFFRLLILGFKIIQLGLWTAVLVVAMLAWIVGPIFATAMLVRQLIPL